MATTLEELTVKVTVDSGGAIKGFKDLEGRALKFKVKIDDAGGAVEQFGKALGLNRLEVTNLNQALELANKAFKFLEMTVGSNVKAFLAADSVQKKMGTTLRLIGERDVFGTTQRLNEFSQQLAKASAVEDEQATSLLRMARQMGLSNEEAERMVQTAADVAAALDEDVGQSFDRLKDSLKGSSRGISEVLPQLKNMGPEALKSGDGIKYLNEALKGFAQADLETPEGRLKRIKNIIGDVQETIGAGILKGAGFDPADLASFEKLTGYLEDIEAGTAAVVGAMKSFLLIMKDIVTLGFSPFVTVLTLSVSLIKDLVGAVKNFDLGKLTTGFKELVSGNLSKAGEAFSGLLNNFTELKAGARVSVNAVGGAFTDIKDQILGTNDAVGETTNSLDKLGKDIKKLPKLPPIVSDEQRKLLEDLGKKVSEIQRTVGASSASEADQARLRTAAVFEELAAMEKKLRSSKALTKEAKAQLAAGGAAAGAALVLELDKQRLATLKTLRDENLALIGELSQVADYGKEDYELAQDQLGIELQMIDAKIAQLAKDGEMNAEAVALLKINRQITKELGDRKIEALEPTTIKSVVGSLKTAFAAGKSAFDGLKNINSGKLLETFKSLGPTIVDGIMNADLGSIGETIADGFSAAAQGVLAMFSPDTIGQLSSWVDMIGNLPDELLKAFDNLDKVIVKFLDKAPEAFNKLVDALPGIIDKILAKLPELIGAFADIIGKILDQLPAIFSKIFDALPGIIDKLGDALPGIILKLFDAIGKIIAKLIATIPDILLELFNDLPAIIEAIIEGLIAAMGDIVAAFVDFLIGGGLEKIVAAFIRMVPRIVVAIVQGIVRGLARALKSIFGGVQIKMPPALEELPQKFADGFKKLADNATAASEDVFKVIEIGAAGRAKSTAEKLQDAINAATEFYENVADGIWEKLKKLWEWIVARLESLWNFLKQIWDGVLTLLQTLWDALKAIWDNVLAILQTLWDALKAIWDTVLATLTTLWDALKGIWDNAIAALGVLWTTLQTLWDGVTSKLTELWESLGKVWEEKIKPIVESLAKIPEAFGKVWTDKIKPIMDGFTKALNDSWAAATKAFDGIGSKVSGWGKSIWTGFTEAVKDVGSFFKNWGGKIWEGLTTAIKDVGSQFVGWGKKMWEGLTSAVKDPAAAFKKWGNNIWDGLTTAVKDPGKTFSGWGSKIWSGLKDGISGLKEAIQKQLDKLNPANLFSKMFDTSGWSGKGKVENTLGIDVPFVSFAQGGIVPGTAPVGGDSAINDRILAMVSSGEAIIPRSLMDIAWVRRLVESLLSGNLSVQSFKIGGVVGEAISGGGGGGGGGLGSIGDALGGLAETGGEAFAGLGELSEDALQGLSDFLEGLDPSKLWDKVLAKVADGVMNMFSSNAFADGGIVGEPYAPMGAPMTVSFSGASGGGGNSSFSPQYNVTMHVNTTQTVDGDKLVAQVLERIKRDSVDGRQVISKRGVF